jgi:glycosyltransferase involved in cell wall biosynthesis
LLPVSNESCGGAEQMLSVLEAEMADRGHLTTIAACSGSSAKGLVFATGREVIERDQFDHRNAEHETRILELVRSTRGTFDLIHDKSGSFWRHAGQCDVPVLATLHLPRSFYPSDGFNALPDNLYFNCVSDAQRKSFGDVEKVMGVVKNGIALQQFPLSADKHDYLMWMGRICEEKAPHLAIEVAQRTGLPLVLAGQVYPFSYHQKYYERMIRPHLGGTQPRISFFETPSIATKSELLKNARALLVTSLVEETSSLVAMEAMACGTPVIGFRRGALPEVVVDGTTGFVVDDAVQMSTAVKDVSWIVPRVCRAHVKLNYSATRMASEYEALYQRVIDKSAEGSLRRSAA